MSVLGLNGGLIGKQHNVAEQSVRGSIEIVAAFQHVRVGQTGSLTLINGSPSYVPEVALQANDLCIVASCTGSVADRTSILTPTDFTTLESVYANDTYDTNLVVSYKFLTGPSDNSLTYPTGSGSTADGLVTLIYILRNVDTTTPFDVTTTSAITTNTAIPTFSSITPVTPGAKVLVAMGNGRIGGLAYFTAMDNTDVLLSDSVNETYDVTGGFAYHSWVSGTYTPATPTFSGSDSTSYSSASITMAVRPGLITENVYNTYEKTGVWNIPAVYQNKIGI